MADNQTEKQKVQELIDKLERGLTELFNSDSWGRKKGNNGSGKNWKVYF